MADPCRPVTGYEYDQVQSAKRAVFHCRVIAVMIVFLAFSASIISIVLLVLRPHLPEFSLESVSVSNFNISALASDRPALSGDWSIEFSVFNPNKKTSISIQNLTAEVFYRSTFLAETRVAPFFTAVKDRSYVNATFSARNSYVAKLIATGLDANRRGGTVFFNFRVWARVGWRMRRRLLRVLCENVGVRISSASGTGKLIGGPKKCCVYARNPYSYQ